MSDPRLALAPAPFSLHKEVCDGDCIEGSNGWTHLTILFSPPDDESIECESWKIPTVDARAVEDAEVAAWEVLSGLEQAYVWGALATQSRRAIDTEAQKLRDCLAELVAACEFEELQMALAGNPNVIERAADRFNQARDAARQLLDEIEDV